MTDSAVPVRRWYPQALDARQFTEHVVKLVLDARGTVDRTWLATSLCSDELTSTATTLPVQFGGVFPLGGLAGLPFAGQTGLAAWAAHLPPGGTGVVWYGPHIGLGDDGELGLVQRRHQAGPTTCCGALCAALERFVTTPGQPTESSPDDYQQAELERRLAPVADRLLAATVPLQAAIDWLWEQIDDEVTRLLAWGQERLAAVTLVRLGGVLIHTAHGQPDWFEVRRQQVDRPAG